MARRRLARKSEPEQDVWLTCEIRRAGRPWLEFRCKLGTDKLQAVVYYPDGTVEAVENTTPEKLLANLEELGREKGWTVGVRERSAPSSDIDEQSTTAVSLTTASVGASLGLIPP